MGFDAVPEEICLIIAEHLSSKDLNNFLRTCRELSHLLTPCLHRLGLQNRDDLTALQWAVKRGHESLVELAISKGARVNVITRYDKFSILHLAVKSGRFKPKIIRKLVKYGAEIGAKDGKLRTPLHLAVVAHCWQAVKELLSLGAGRKEDPPNGLNNLAHCAARAGEVDCIRSFVAVGIDFHARGFEGSTILHEAFSNEKTFFATARYILEQEEGKTIVNAKDSDGCTPMHLLLSRHTLFFEDPNRRKMFKLLLQCGADINAQNGALDTPVHIIAGWSNNRTILDLLPACFDPSIKGCYGDTVLHRAIRQTDESLQYLLELKGGKLAINIPDNEGSTPLHHVALFGNSKKVELLLKFGADARAKDKNRNTPLMYAKHRGDPHILYEFEAYWGRVKWEKIARYNRWDYRDIKALR